MAYKILEADSFDLLNAIPDKKGGAITVVSFSSDSSKCLVGFESGLFFVYDTNDWKTIPISGVKQFDEPVSAADWTQDSKIMVLEDSNQNTQWFKVVGNVMKSILSLEDLQLNTLKWRNGSVYSCWDVLLDDLDQRIPKTDQPGRQ